MPISLLLCTLCYQVGVSLPACHKELLQSPAWSEGPQARVHAVGEEQDRALRACWNLKPAFTEAPAATTAHFLTLPGH